MKSFFLLSTPFLLLAAVLLSCKSEPNFDPIPRIEYRSASRTLITKDNNDVDSVSVEIYFEDGNGDLGLTEKETFNPPYITFPGNFLVSVYKKNGNNYEFVVGFFNTLDARFEPIGDISAGKPLSGTIRKGVLINHSLKLLQPGDIYKLRIQILDRALNGSNFVDTEDLVFGG